MNTRYYKLLFTGVIFINPTLSSFRTQYPEGLRYFISFGLGAISAVIITLALIHKNQEAETQAPGVEAAEMQAAVTISPGVSLVASPSPRSISKEQHTIDLTGFCTLSRSPISSVSASPCSISNKSNSKLAKQKPMIDLQPQDTTNIQHCEDTLPRNKALHRENLPISQDQVRIVGPPENLDRPRLPSFRSYRGGKKPKAAPESSAVSSDSSTELREAPEEENHTILPLKKKAALAEEKREAEGRKSWAEYKAAEKERITAEALAAEKKEIWEKDLKDFGNEIALGFIEYHNLITNEGSGDTYKKSDGTIVQGKDADNIAQEMSSINIKLICLCVKKFKDNFGKMEPQDEQTYQKLLNPNLTDLRFIEELLKIGSNLPGREYKISKITKDDDRGYNNYITNRHDINLELSHKLIKILNNLMEYILDVYVTETNHDTTPKRKINIIEFITLESERIERF